MRIADDVARAMNLLAIVAALALEQWRAFDGAAPSSARSSRMRAASSSGSMAARSAQGVLATVLAIGPPVAVSAARRGGSLDHVHPALGLLVNVAVLYLLMGFRHFSHSVSAIVAALKGGDIVAARRALAAWRGGVAARTSPSRIRAPRDRARSRRRVSAGVRRAVLVHGVARSGRAPCCIARRCCLPTSGKARSRRRHQRARALAARLRRARAEAAGLARLDSGAADRAVVRHRRRLRGRHLLLAHAGAAWPVAQGGPTYGILLASGAGALGVQLGGPVPAAGGDIDPRPEIGIGDPVEADVLPSARRARLASAHAVAAARVPAVARELGAVGIGRKRVHRAEPWAARGLAQQRLQQQPRAAGRRSPRATAACTAQPGSESWRQSRKRHCGMRSRNSTNASRDRVRRDNARVRTPSCRASRRSSRRRRAAGRARSTSSCGGRCAAPPEISPMRAAAPGKQRIDQRRLAHARLPDDDAVLPREQRPQRRDVAASPTPARPGSRAPHTARSARRIARTPAGRDLLTTSTNRQCSRLRRDDPAVQQMLVDGHVRRDDAEHLRDVRGDQLFPEASERYSRLRRGSIASIAPPSRFARDAHAVAAGERHRAAFQHACERAAGVEIDDVMAPVRRDDEPARQARQPAGARCRAAPRRSPGEQAIGLRRADDVVARHAAGVVRRPRDDAAVVARRAGRDGGPRDWRSTRAR